MMHVNPFKDAGEAQGDGMRRYRETFAEVEALGAQVRRARRQADLSLKRVNAVPEPHSVGNAVFAVELERHRADRETMFEAMRKLDAARRALRAIASDFVLEQDKTAAADLRRPA
ncbi:hypothetical protein IG197_27950 (plasmid) [Aminobacter sp. SR38]|jgi:hypothetical protein|uniref:hypothetical protein n=1 Tax=Aminobacter sp. SR38 TaxID=2774562 RepID=UPI0017818921|nr:hypothetical protein [Aminobacter sp. SR38]QOF74644.1 hypothetical protein IG197_27950 [Aminobacter sp. SR38]